MVVRSLWSPSTGLGGVPWLLLLNLGKSKFPSPVPGEGSSLGEICPLRTKGSEQKATSAMTHQREMKIVFRLEKNPFESDTFASRI